MYPDLDFFAQNLRLDYFFSFYARTYHSVIESESIPRVLTRLLRAASRVNKLLYTDISGEYFARTTKGVEGKGEKRERNKFAAIMKRNERRGALVSALDKPATRSRCDAIRCNAMQFRAMSRLHRGRGSISRIGLSSSSFVVVAPL